MKFGKAWNQEEEETTTGGGSDYLRYFKDDVTTFRILQEPDEWVDYWEHYNPGGFPFPCTRDRNTCPGCTSNNEKMKKASKKIAIQVQQGEWVNAYKIPKTVAEKLATRAERIGTITDRDYSIYKIKSKNADGSVKTDYDVEGQDKIPVDIAALKDKFKDIEEILSNMYEQSWGDSDKAKQTNAKAEEAEKEDNLREKLANSPKEEIPDWAAKDEKVEKAQGAKADEPKVWTEEELRGMRLDQIIKVCLDEGVGEPPQDAKTTDQVVDWLLEQ